MLGFFLIAKCNIWLFICSGIFWHFNCFYFSLLFFSSCNSHSTDYFFNTVKWGFLFCFALFSLRNISADIKLSNIFVLSVVPLPWQCNTVKWGDFELLPAVEYLMVWKPQYCGQSQHPFRERRTQTGYVESRCPQIYRDVELVSH